MAVTQNTLIGKSRGSVGNATFTTWKGLNVLKSKPVSVANPRTPGQVIQRNRLSLMVEVYRTISSVLALGFTEGAVQQSSYNAFVSDNIIRATNALPDNTVELIPEELLISKGSIGVTPIGAVNILPSGNELEVTWDQTVIPVGGASTDNALLVVKYTDGNVFAVGDQSINRDTGRYVIDLGEDIGTIQPVRAYLGFYSPTQRKSSDSVNLEL